MRTGLRIRFAALVAALLALGAAPAAGAKAPAKPPTVSARVPVLLTDVARIEPLPKPGTGATPATVGLDGVGEYRGVLELRRTAAGVGAVNEVALDDYLKGISEVPSSWPAEALRAQAIAARTYLLWVLDSPPAGDAAALGAQICATDSCQVYSGVAKERAPNGDHWAEAVQDTAGLALLSGGGPILAKYSACNGGRSVSGGKPYLKAVDDPDDARCPLYRWGLGLSYDDVGRALAVPGTVKAVRATAEDVQVDWSAADGGAGHTTVPRTEFRAKVDAAVGPPPDRSHAVPSILFGLRPDDAGRVATLDGRGYGHGIGMSQWGAYGKALRGLNAAAILAAYYGGIQPTRVPAAKLPARVRVALSTGEAPRPPADPPAPSGRAPAPGTAAPPPRPAQGPAVVSASGPFRVVDAKGNVVVPVATGSWRVVPAAKGLQLLPPRDQAGAPGVTLLGIEPASPLPGQPVTVRVRSNLPGVVSATGQPPGGPAAPVMAPQLQLTAAQEYRLTLPAATRPGPYSVTVTADSGPARTATLTVRPLVADPAAPPGPAADGGGPAGGLLAGLVGAGPVGAELLADAPTGGNPDGRVTSGGTAQMLVAADRAVPARASRSERFRPIGSSSPDPVLGPADRYGTGVLLAGLAGFGLWRFRARRARPAMAAAGPPPAVAAAAPPSAVAAAVPPPAPPRVMRVETPDPLD